MKMKKRGLLHSACITRNTTIRTTDIMKNQPEVENKNPFFPNEVTIDL